MSVSFSCTDWTFLQVSSVPKDMLLETGAPTGRFLQTYFCIVFALLALQQPFAYL